MRLDDDDLYDYEQDSFDEDGAIAEVVDALKPEKVTEADAEAELDKVDWDIDVAVANLRKRLAKPKPKPQAQPKGKLTPLQMLALRRKAAAADNPTDTSQEDPVLPHEDQPQPTEPEKKNPSLAELAAQRRAAAEPKTSALEKLRQRKTFQQQQRQEQQEQQQLQQLQEQKNKVQAPNSFKNSEPARPPPWQPEISYVVPPSVGLGKPSAIGALIGFVQHRTYFSRTSLDSKTNSLATAKSAASAFSQPSPDDRVLNAQNSAFQQQQPAAKQSAAKQPATKQPATKQPAKQAQANKEASNSGSNIGSGSGSGKPASKAVEAMKATASGKSDLLARLAALDVKPNCSFVVIGHVDAGKSTLMGRLLLDSGALNAKTVQKYEHESKKAGKPSFWLAWALDATSEERERGVTVDIGEATFSTPAANYTVLDAPGHRDYVPNMIAGVAQADVAVLVVDSDTNAFESGFSLDGQTKEHAVLARSLGVDRMVVAVNKMDTKNWDERRFVEISSQLTEFLTHKVGFRGDNIVYVPTSGISGDNVVNKPTSLPQAAWYTGPSLVGALDEITKARAASEQQSAQSLATQPTRFAVSNAYTEAFQSTVIVSGRTLSGCIEPGDALEIVNTHELIKVKSIVDREFLVAGEQGELKLQMEGCSTVGSNNNNNSNNGEDVLTTVSGVQSVVRPGNVIAGYGAGLVVTKEFVAKVRLFDVPRPVLPGMPLAFHLGRVEDTVRVASILGPLDPGAASSTRKLRHLSKGIAARVRLRLDTPTVLANQATCKDLSRFVLRINGITIGGGVVEDPSPSNK